MFDSQMKKNQISLSGLFKVVVCEVHKESRVSWFSDTRRTTLGGNASSESSYVLDARRRAQLWLIVAQSENGEKS